MVAPDEKYKDHLSYFGSSCGECVCVNKLFNGSPSNSCSYFTQNNKCELVEAPEDKLGYHQSIKFMKTI